MCVCVCTYIHIDIYLFFILKVLSLHVYELYTYLVLYIIKQNNFFFVIMNTWIAII